MSEEELDQRILEHLEPFTIILDIGCGDGHLVNALVAQKGCRVIGLDSSDHGFAEAKMTAHHHLVECIECDACQIAFQDGYFRGGHPEVFITSHRRDAAGSESNSPHTGIWGKSADRRMAGGR